MLLKTKLTNQLNTAAIAQEMEIEIFLKNISINGVKRGCSGHIVNKTTGACVYVDTETFCYSPLAGKAMYRLARDTKDFSSNSLKNGYNRWATEEDLASAVILLLKREKPDI